MSALIATTHQDGAPGIAGLQRGNFTGQIHVVTLPPSAALGATAQRVYLPPSVAAIEKRPSVGLYGNRWYGVGGHTANLLIDEEFRCNRQSLPAPDVEPAVAVGAGTNVQICYTRFYDEVTRERGPLSIGKTVTGDLNRVWTALPTEVPNERVIIEGTFNFAAGTVTAVANNTNIGDLRPGDRIAVSTDLTRWAQLRSITSQSAFVIDDTAMAGAGVSLVAKTFSRASHVEIWVSVFGSLPRFITRVRLGTTTITEATATLALGEAETESFGPMPRGEISLIYNDRQLVAGVEGHRDTLYLSAIGFPERDEGLRVLTPYNEPIVGMFRYRTYVVLLCPDSSYIVRGYTEDDVSRDPLDADIGGIGHHGNVVVRGKVYVPSKDGILIFNGAFHPGVPTRQTEWSVKYGGDSNTREAQASRVAFEEGFAISSRGDTTYQFYPYIKWIGASVSATGQLTANSLLSWDRTYAHCWIGDYSKVAPISTGDVATPEWLSDSLATPDGGYVTAAAYIQITGEKIGRVYRGTSLGHIYIEDDDLEYTGEAVFAGPHMLFGDPGGTDDEGHNLKRLWSYVSCEYGTGKIRVWPGSEFAYPPDIEPVNHILNTAAPAYTDNIVAGLQTNLSMTMQAQTVRTHPVEKVGHGFTVEMRFTNPRKVRIIGYGGEWEEGLNRRYPYTDAQGG